MSNGKRIVYILKNDAQPPPYYVGLTADLRTRITAHNEGRCQHTAAGRPWHVDVFVKFFDAARALAFERDSIAKATAQSKRADERPDHELFRLMSFLA
jgi:predicted GIY-YIG superfamily endonuclease